MCVAARDLWPEDDKWPELNLPPDTCKSVESLILRLAYYSPSENTYVNFTENALPMRSRSISS